MNFKTSTGNFHAIVIQAKTLLGPKLQEPDPCFISSRGNKFHPNFLNFCFRLKRKINPLQRMKNLRIELYWWKNLG